MWSGGAMGSGAFIPPFINPRPSHLAQIVTSNYFSFGNISKFIHPFQNGRLISAEIRDLAVARWVFYLPPNQKPVEDLYVIVRLMDGLQSGTGSFN